MPLTTIQGDTGSGKTLIFMWFMVKYFSKAEKYGNFETKLPNWHKVSIMELTELPDTDKIRIVVRDEGYTDYDNRRSMEEEQIFNSYIPMQHRKSNISLTVITQLDILDLRVSGFEKFRIIAHDRPIYNKDGTLFEGDFHYTFLNKYGKQTRFTMPYKTALKLFPLYRTEEKIMPRGYDKMKFNIRMKDPKQRKQIIIDITDEIVKKYGLPESKKELTHNWIKDKMLDLEKDLEMKLEPFIYIKLKEKME